MPRRILYLVLMLVLICSALVFTKPAEATTASHIDTRMAELEALAQRGLYFTKSGNACTNASDADCNVGNVIASDSVFRSQSGLTFWPSSAYKLPSHARFDSGSPFMAGTRGYSCCGFANFAGWYLFADSTSSTVTFKKVIDCPVKEVYKYAQKGDIISFPTSGSVKHSLVYISGTSSSLRVLDCNWGSTCLIRVRNHTTQMNNMASISRCTTHPNVKDIYELNSITTSDNHRYVLYGGRWSWDEAYAYCNSLGDGWSLATITTAEEQSVVSNLVSGWNGHTYGGFAWIGAQYTGGSWQWTTDETYSYSNWASNSSASSSNKYATIVGVTGTTGGTSFTSGKWYALSTMPTWGQPGFVAEYTPGDEQTYDHSSTYYKFPSGEINIDDFTSVWGQLDNPYFIGNISGSNILSIDFSIYDVGENGQLTYNCDPGRTCSISYSEGCYGVDINDIIRNQFSWTPAIGTYWARLAITIPDDETEWAAYIVEGEPFTLSENVNPTPDPGITEVTFTRPTGNVQSRIAELRNEIPNGWYWNNWTSSTIGSYSQINYTLNNGNTFSVSTKPCVNNNGTHTGGDNRYWGAWHGTKGCGFARTMFDLTWGMDTEADGYLYRLTRTDHEDYYFLYYLAPGDMIWTGSRYLFVTSVSNINIGYAAVNLNGDCQISWGNTTGVYDIAVEMMNAAASGNYGYVISPTPINFGSQCFTYSKYEVVSGSIALKRTALTSSLITVSATLSTGDVFYASQDHVDTDSNGNKWYYCRTENGEYGWAMLTASNSRLINETARPFDESTFVCTLPSGHYDTNVFAGNYKTPNTYISGVVGGDDLSAVSLMIYMTDANGNKSNAYADGCIHYSEGIINGVYSEVDLSDIVSTLNWQPEDGGYYVEVRVVTRVGNISQDHVFSGDVFKLYTDSTVCPTDISIDVSDQTLQFFETEFEQSVNLYFEPSNVTYKRIDVTSSDSRVYSYYDKNNQYLIVHGSWDGEEYSATLTITAENLTASNPQATITVHNSLRANCPHDGETYTYYDTDDINSDGQYRYYTICMACGETLDTGYVTLVTPTRITLTPSTVESESWPNNGTYYELETSIEPANANYFDIRTGTDSSFYCGFDEADRVIYVIWDANTNDSGVVHITAYYPDGSPSTTVDLPITVRPHEHNIVQGCFGELTDQGWLVLTYCVNCGEVFGESYTDTYHVAGDEPIQVIPATCTEEGFEYYICTICGEEFNVMIDPLGHDWGEYAVTTEPGCATDGEEISTCSRCGATQTRELAPTGHTVVTDEAVAATCTETGLTEGSHCSKCGEVFTEQEVIPELGHDWGEYVVTAEPGCETVGEETSTCSRCGATQTREIPATGHTVVTDAAVAATCTETGLTEGSHCSVCDKVLVAQEETPALGHDWGEYVITIEPICGGVAGEETSMCQREGCGETRTREIPPLHHAWGEYVVTTAPTCEEVGEETSNCSRCGATQTREIPATGHTVVTDAAVAATCTETGLTEGSHCSVCDKVLVAQEETPALGHDWGEYVVTTAPKCEEAGEETSTCSRCNATRTNEIPATGHTAVTDEAVSATCTETGLTEGSHCSVCDKVLVAQEETPALGHDWGEYVVTTAPKCEEAGEETSTCSRCNATRTNEIPATGHTAVTDEAVSATCTETGLTEGSHCSVCGKVLMAQEELPKLDHTPGEWVTVIEPTYTSTGLKELHCAECGEVIDSQIMPKLEPEIPDPIVQTKTARKGEEVTISIYANSNDANYIIVSYSYNSEVFELISYEATAGGMASETRFIAANINNAINGKIGSVTLKVKDTATDGTYRLSISVVEAYNNDTVDVGCKAAADIIKIVSKIAGDLNNDGNVNGKDNILLMQYLAGRNVNINMVNADINSDGAVNGKDNILLMQYLAGRPSQYIGH